MKHNIVVWGFHFALWCVPAGTAYLIHRRGEWRRGAWLILILLGLVAIPFLWRVSEPAELYSDFNKAYYPAGYFILQSPGALYHPEFSELGFVNVPVVALLFTPLSRLSLVQAQNVFLCLGVLAAAGSCFALIRGGKAVSWRKAFVVGLFLLNGPLYYSLREGNLTHFVLPLLVAAVFSIEMGRDIALGVLLTAAALIKPPLALLLCYYGVKRRWRVLAGAGAAMSLLAVISLALAGVDSHLQWWRRCIQPGTARPLAAYNVQSLSGFLARLFAPQGITSWRGLELSWSFNALHYLLLAVLAGMMVLVFWRARRGAGPEAEKIEFTAVLSLALLASPISWTHYYLLLLLPLSLYLGGQLAVPAGRRWFVLTALVGVLISPPVLGVSSTGLGARLLVSHYFLGGLLLFGVLLAARRCSAIARIHLRLVGEFDKPLRCHERKGRCRAA